MYMLRDFRDLFYPIELEYEFLNTFSVLWVEACIAKVIISFCCQESFHWKHNEGKIISLISMVV